MDKLRKKLTDAIWIGEMLYKTGKVTGSSANMSFLHENKIYISASGTCFGRLTEEDFAIVDLKGNILSKRNPSKEFPLHMQLYNYFDDVGAVLHTHSHYCTLWSCLKYKNIHNVMPNITPYLNMKLGKISLVPYAKPGSQALFRAFKNTLDVNKGFLLAHHGPIVGQKDLLSAYYCLEELEETARIAWDLKDIDVDEIDS